MLRTRLLETRRAKLMVAVTMTLLLALFVMVPEANAATRSLTVQKSGLQTGTVTSSPEGINCGSTCTASFPEECLVENTHGACITFGPSSVTLTTTVPSGFAPTWGGATCDEGVQTGTSCTVPADNNTVSVHYGDASAPGVTLTSPTSGFKRGTITLAANASDPQTGITRVDFLVGGISVNSDISAPYEYTYNTTSRADGPTQVTARAVNSDGMQSTSASTSITIDNTPPSLSINSGPEDQTFTGGSTQIWTFSTSDQTSGIQSVQCSVVRTELSASYGNCSGGSSHSVSGLQEGSYTFYVKARDNAGNESVRTRTFSIDATSPDTNIQNKPDNPTNSASADFTYTSTETNSTFQCRLDGPSNAHGFSSCGQAGKSYSNLADGTYTFLVKARDQVGNEDQTPASYEWTVDATSPTVETWGPKGKKVSPGAMPTVTFSEAMNEATVVASAAGKHVNFVLKKGTTVVPAVVTYTESGTTFKAVLDPDRNLKRGAKYTATVTPGAEDEAGNALVRKSWSFTIKR